MTVSAASRNRIAEIIYRPGALVTKASVSVDLSKVPPAMNVQLHRALNGGYHTAAQGVIAQAYKFLLQSFEVPGVTVLKSNVKCSYGYRLDLYNSDDMDLSQLQDLLTADKTTFRMSEAYTQQATKDSRGLKYKLEALGKITKNTYDGIRTAHLSQLKDFKLLADALAPWRANPIWQERTEQARNALRTGAVVTLQEDDA